MKPKTLFSLTMIVPFLIIYAAGFAQTISLRDQPAGTSGSDSILFSSLVSRYTRSIEQADTLLGSQLWADSDEVSLISPMGNEYGWQGIQNIYKMFGDFFTAKKLSFFDLKTTVYDHVAWLQFYWIFDAVLRTDNSPVQTKGRETQIWRKLNGEWRLVHVHYSGMPDPVK